ncbi:MAG: cysteine--tRNA ligase [Deltaproteobacteria bacterium]|nr:cysteine--tRNA ligase [Deltaproteobacteria bacterium]
MPLTLYNSANRRKETFEPMQEGRVGMYVCGVTVYDLCHIGHARSAIVFDVLSRYLRARGFEVTYVRNFTDVDDKIIDRANKLGKETAEIAEEYIDAFYEDMDRLFVMKADREPRATEHIDAMIEMISTLIEKGHAYVEGGDVFYSVESLRSYGALSGRKLEDMKAGSRIAVDERKRHPMDFVLWKAVKPGEPQWPSPWGPGRPGWHMECSVMSNHFLGPTFDIHGGGKDLIFPHHENERAQSIAANGGQFARYWVHNGFVTVESEKMSKSLGNFLTIRDALETYHPEVLRLFLLSMHYRKPLDFSRDAVQDLQSGLVRIYRTLQRLNGELGEPEDRGAADGSGFLAGDQEDPFLREFIRLMDDDINTAGAMGLVFEKVKEINRIMDSMGDTADPGTGARLEAERRNILLAGRVLGVFNERPEDFFKKVSEASDSLDTAEIEDLISRRARARADKDWAGADAIRDRLQAMGVVLEDAPGGTTTWRYVL